jgi:hypothetical protein
MTNYTNQQKAFTDVVSIDAWHEKLSSLTPRVDLHADVVFRTARVGGEAESQVRFRLSVKRAELILIIPELERFAVDKRFVARFGKVKSMTQSFTQTTKVVGRVDADAKAAVGLSTMSASVGAKARANLQRSSEKKLKASEKRTSISVTYRFDNAENNNCWTLEPGIGSVLEGRPWDAAKSPIVKLVDQRVDRERGIEPTVRLEIRCLREDLEITDLELKNTGLWEELKERVGGKNRLKAAEAYIRNRLEEAGLDAGDMSDRFVKITLVDVFANNGWIG